MRRLYYLIITLLLFSIESTFSAFEGKNDFMSNPAFGVYSFLPNDYFHNRKFIFSTSGSRLYSMSECNEVNAGLLSFFTFALVGMDVSFFGSELYNETELGLSLFTGSKTLFGIRIKIMKLGIRGYSSHFFGSDDIFFLSQNSFFHFQSIYNNAISFGYNYVEEKPTSSFSSLLRLYPSDWNSFNIKITFSEFTGTRFEIGNGIRLSDKLSFGGGFDIETRAISSNLLLSLGSSDLTYSVSIHPELGLTHTVGFIISQKKTNHRNRIVNMKIKHH